jgi:asparagine N-glycosylation enzyme membrane subunit Stt3
MKHLPTLLIASGIIFAFVTRVILPWHNTFTPFGVVLNTPDAYIMLRYADLYPNFPIWDWFSNYPMGAPAFKSLVFPSMIALLAKLTGVSNWVAAAVLPVILFYLTLIPIYSVAKKLFNAQVAAGSVFLFCLLPGEVLERSVLGAADYHVWEMFLLTSIMLFLMKKGWWVFMAVVAFVLYMLSWAGAPLALLIVYCAGCLFVFLWLKDGPLRFIWVIACALTLWGISVSFPGLFVQGLKLVMIDIKQSNFEMQPLFFTAGQFEMISMWSYFGLIFFCNLIAIGWFTARALKTQSFNDCLFLSWSVITLWLMICMRRFEYYAAINAAILTVAVLWYGVPPLIYRMVYNHRIIDRERVARYAIFVILLICGPLINTDYRLATGYGNRPSVYWQQVCAWFSDSSAYYSGAKPAYGVFTEWNYGYYLIAIGHQAVLSTPGYWPEASSVASRILISNDIQDSLNDLKELGMKYVVIDNVMLYDNLSIEENVAGIKASNLFDTFMYKVYFQRVPEAKMVYHAGDVRVFEIE